MKDDQPVPDNVEWQQQIEDMGRVQNPRLKGGQKRNARIVVGVPERELEILELGNPQEFRWNEKGSEVSLAENDLGGENRVEIQHANNQKE